MVLELQKAEREKIFLKMSSFYTTISNINTCLKTHIEIATVFASKNFVILGTDTKNNEEFGFTNVQRLNSKTRGGGKVSSKLLERPLD
jgi:hypothetical protein